MNRVLQSTAFAFSKHFSRHVNVVPTLTVHNENARNIEGRQVEATARGRRQVLGIQKSEERVLGDENICEKYLTNLWPVLGGGFLFLSLPLAKRAKIFFLCISYAAFHIQSAAEQRGDINLVQFTGYTRELMMQSSCSGFARAPGLVLSARNAQIYLALALDASSMLSVVE